MRTKMNFTPDLTIGLEAKSSLAQKSRSGWVNRGIYPGGLEKSLTFRKNEGFPRVRSVLPPYHAETVQLHQENLARAALRFWLSHPEYELSKLADLGNLHDVPEYDMPDWTPQDNIPAEHKRDREIVILHRLAENVTGGPGILRTGMDYIDQISPEAKIIHQLDKIDPSIRAMSYLQHFAEIEAFYRDKDHPERREWLMKVERFEGLKFEDKFQAMQESLKEFFPYARKRITHPDLVKVYDFMMENTFPKIDPFKIYFTLLEVSGNKGVLEALKVSQ